MENENNFLDKILKDKILDNTVVIVVIFALVGLFVAVVTFGILKSQAQGEFHSYQVGGAIAGALVSTSLLASLYLQIRKSSNEPEKLREQIEVNQQKFREQIEVLQQKLLRGTPHPSGYEVEISEQQKIVLARPEKWHKRGGIMFDFERVEMSPEDSYPARFTCSFVPITEVYDKLGRDDFYRIFERNIRQNPRNFYPRSEYIFIGGESQSTKCIKLVAGQYTRLEFYKNPYGGKNIMEVFQVTEDEYSKNDPSHSASKSATSAVEQNQPTMTEEHPNDSIPVTVKYAKISHMFVACYRKDLNNVYFFEFMDDDDHFVNSSEIFNQVLNSTRFLN